MRIKNLISTFALLIIFVSCKNNQKSEPVESINYSEEQLDITTSIYPENLSKVFDAHGGLDNWNAMNYLAFTMPKEKGDEVTTTDLKNRKSLIETQNYIIGYNGADVWLKNTGDKPYKGNPRFYYNLMFYFYAMPFILADDGIIYNDVEPLKFEGTVYPGIRISYENGVGESSEDEYVLYYNPDTYKMEWLGYTVTFHTKKKGKELHFRRFSDWQEVNGLLLPKTMDRYKYKDNLPTTVHSESHFTDIKITKEKPNQQIFEVLEGAKIID